MSIADRLDLAELIARYAAHVDSREFDEVVNLFTEDAELVVPDPPDHLGPRHRHAGRAAIGSVLDGVAAFPLTRHTLAGELFQQGEGPDDATGRVTGIAHHLAERAPGEATDLVWHLRYKDLYRRSAGVWRIAARSVTIDWIEVRPVRRWHPQE